MSAEKSRGKGRNYLLDGGAKPPPGLVNYAISRRTPKTDPTKEFLGNIYEDAPVVGFQVYDNDVKVVRAAKNPDELALRLQGCKRGTIESLSARSRRRLAFVAANSPISLKSFLTLTYPREWPHDGKEVKRQLRAILASMRRRFGKFHYLWFLEFQRRGAPHLHAFLEFDLPGPYVILRRKLRERNAKVNGEIQDWVSRRWFEIVGSCDDRHLRAGACLEVVQKADGAARYVAKECSKTFQKDVPALYQNVGRFWGTSRGFPPPESPTIKAGPAKLRQFFGETIAGPDGRIYPVLHGKGKVDFPGKNSLVKSCDQGGS